MVPVEGLENFLLQRIVFKILDGGMCCIFNEFLNPVVLTCKVTFGSVVGLLQGFKDLVFHVSIEVSSKLPEDEGGFAFCLDFESFVREA